MLVLWCHPLLHASGQWAINVNAKLLIEHERLKPTWRVVLRQVTATGFSRWAYAILKHDIESLPDAMEHAGWIKCREVRRGHRQTNSKYPSP